MGVRRNGGRPGAREAPDCIRQALYRLTPGQCPGLAALVGRMHDFGNIRVDDDLEAAQAAARRGGGRVPGARNAAHRAGRRTRDRVRPLPRLCRRHRRSPSSTGTRTPTCGPLHRGARPLGIALPAGARACLRPCAALHRRRPAARTPSATAHVDYLAARGGRVVWRDERDRRARIDALVADAAEDRLVSFDMDAVDQALAPG